jgi:hypothetical protein
LVCGLGSNPTKEKNNDRKVGVNRSNNGVMVPIMEKLIMSS